MRSRKLTEDFPENTILTSIRMNKLRIGSLPSTKPTSFLLPAGPQGPGNQTTDYDYDPTIDEYEMWRQQARAYARKKAREAERRQSELVKTLLRIFNTTAILIIMFNVLLTIDYFLPRQEHDQRILSYTTAYERTGTKTSSTRVYRYDDLIFEDFHMRFDGGEIKNLGNYSKATVVATMIFDEPMFAKITIDGVEKVHEQVYNVYHVFGFLIPALFVILLLYFL